MALMDSPEARIHQSPRTAVKPKAKAAPKKVARRKTTTPRTVVARKRRVASNSQNTSSPRRRRSTNRTTSNRSSNSSRSNAIRRRANRASTNRNPQRAAPKPSPPPVAKTITPPAPPKPAPPSVDQFLAGDSTYQRQLAAYNKALADFQTDQSLSKTDYETGYQNTIRDINLSQQDALSDLKDDYAARGLLRSGLYNDSLGDLNQQYSNQRTDVNKQRTSFLDQLVQELSKYRSEQSVQQGNARAEAIRRRAERYNL